MTRLFILLFLFPAISFAQKSVYFYDQTTKNPVNGLYVFDCKNQFIGITNESGLVELVDPCFPLTLKNLEYGTSQLASSTNEVFLEAKAKMLEDVKVSPISKMDLYNSIVKNSSEKISRSSHSVYGVYFETQLWIEKNTKDTMILNRVCDMELEVVPDGKKLDYVIHCSNGNKTIREFALKQNKFDSADVVKMNAFLPKFSGNFKYDLSDTKKYKLEYEENEISKFEGEPNALIFKKGKNNRTYSHDVLYTNRVINSWKYIGMSEDTTSMLGISMSFTRFMKMYQFAIGETSYLNNILNVSQLYMGFDTEQYDIYMAGGFIENQDQTRTLGNSVVVKEIDDYFDKIKFSEGVDQFYKF